MKQRAIVLSTGLLIGLLSSRIDGKSIKHCSDENGPSKTFSIDSVKILKNPSSKSSSFADEPTLRSFKTLCASKLLYSIYTESEVGAQLFSKFTVEAERSNNNNTHISHSDDSNAPIESPLDCESPACSDTKDMLLDSFYHLKRDSHDDSPDHITPVSTPLESSDAEVVKCPLTKSQLGSSSWDLIHSMAANYPDHPDETSKIAALHFAESLARLYPCPLCARDFRRALSSHPIQVETRRDLVLWWCERHNEVSRKIGKPPFPCELKSLDERWRRGGKRCQGKG